MLGISNIINEEVRFTEDCSSKIEYHQKINDDERLGDDE